LLSQLGEKRAAAHEFRAAIEIQESIFSAEPSNDVNCKHLAASYSNLSSLFLRSQPGVARQWVEKAMSLQLRLAKNHPRHRDYQSDLALSYNNLGAILSRLAQWADAERCYLDAITIQQRLVASAPLVSAYRRDLSISYNNLGMSLSAASALTAAEASFKKALAVQRELAERHPQDASVLSGLGGIFNNLGIVHQSQQQWTAAQEAFEQALHVQEQALAQAPNVDQYREALSKHYYNQSQVLLQMGKTVDAAEVVLKRRALWPNDPGRLLRIADELSAICKRIEPGEMRQKYTQEVLAMLRASKDVSAHSHSGNFD
jgi:tetratricopeptide (TPR) repeat protein